MGAYQRKKPAVSSSSLSAVSILIAIPLLYTLCKWLWRYVLSGRCCGARIFVTGDTWILNSVEVY